jgi:hypothetical protein
VEEAPRTHEEHPMGYNLLMYENTEVWNGLSQDDTDVFMHAAGDILEELSAAGEWVGGEGPADASQARRRADRC